MEENFVVFLNSLVDNHWENNDTISEVLEKSGKDLREEVLGEVRAPLSLYEKKLIFLGMMIGSKRTMANLSGSLGSIFRGFPGINDEDGD
jgi:hypothetical protein